VVQYPSLIVFDNLPNGCEMVWNFFATSHGEGVTCIRRSSKERCENELHVHEWTLDIEKAQILQQLGG
jgi:hypothetical protein